MHQKLIKASLIISISGIFILLLISAVSKPKIISEYSELKISDYVQVKGKILSSRSYGEFSIISLDNNITLTCECNLKQNQTIKVTGIVSIYQGKKQIAAETIKVLS